jgi:hypothetical protein
MDKNVSENEYISIGQYQSIEIGAGITSTLFKRAGMSFQSKSLGKQL